MSKVFAKRLIWLAILLLTLFIAWNLIEAVGNLLLYFQRGADPSTALNIVPNVPPDLHVELTWTPDDHDTGREMDPFTRTGVESAYLRAWLQWNLSLLKQEPYGLKTYFVGPALASVSGNIQQLARNGWLVHQVDTTHRLQLHMYSADGSIVSFTDERAEVAQVIYDKAGKRVFYGESEASYDVVMFLEDGNWRVRHWVRTADLSEKAIPTLQTPPNFVGVRDKSLMLNGKPYQIAGMNYYPQATPWDKFWLNYDPVVIGHDFALMHSLGINTIRIFIPFEQFGGASIGSVDMLDPKSTPVPKGKTGPTELHEPLQKLSDLLARAGNNQLHVIVTLFDFRSDYTMLHWPDSDRHLETLLTHYKNDPTILAWDLKNEADLDYRAVGKELVESWLTHTAMRARRYDPNHLLTVGWSTPAAAAESTVPLDFISYHYYVDPNKIVQAYTMMRTAHPHQPVVLSEFGLSTWNSFLFPIGHSDADQAEYYATLLKGLRTTDSAGYLAWTLYDFSYLPPGLGGRWFWQTEPQRRFGILNANGTPKPAAKLLAPGAPLSVAPIPFWQRLLRPFTLTAVLCSILLLALLIFMWKRGWLRKLLFWRKS